MREGDSLARAGAMLSAHTRIAALTFCLCAVPYLGLWVYLSVGMHGSAIEADLPERWLLVVLFILGVFVPSAGVIWIVRWVLKDQLQFRLSGLLEAYGALVFLFASAYAIVQASAVDPTFTGMPVVWSAGEPASLEVHVARLHEVFFDSLYLSVMTITTVGYGDLAPVSRLGRILTAVEGLAGIGFVGVALGHYFSVCLGRRRGQP